MLFKRLAIIVFLNFIHMMLFAQPRQKLSFDLNWRFKMGDPRDIDQNFNYPEVNDLKKTRPDQVALEKELALTRIDPVKQHLGEKTSYVQPAFNSQYWKRVNLPHDWAVELPYNPNGNVSKGMKAIDSLNGTAMGWYRKQFKVPAADNGKTISLEFEGIYRNALFWINGHCLGRNVSGYMGCFYDISQYLNYGGINTVVIRVDASHDEGWWYEGAGIYRHVWLIKTQKVHVANWGTFVHSTVNHAKAVLTIETEIRNDGNGSRSITLTSNLIDKTGHLVATVSSGCISIHAGATNTVRQQLNILNPYLWDVDKPDLYQVRSIIKEGKTIEDTYLTMHGFRSIRFDSDSGFYLNGKRTFLKGVCIHQDHAGVGTAIPDGLEDYRLQKLKDLGVNAYRTSHNPQSPYLYNECDRLGILVMDENRRMSDDTNAVSQLKNMIKRNRNHPSVFIWSLGNEEELIQGTEYGASTVQKLQNVVHRMDTTRLVTEAMNGKWGEGISNVIDVQGFNYLRNGNMDDFRKFNPAKPALATEEGSTHSTRGVYTTDESKGFISSYLPIMRPWSVTPEQWLQYYAARPWVAGGFVWTGIGYRGEPGFKHFPNILSSYGIMDICCFPKDQYYMYQSAWSKDPVLHLMPHWNWPDSIGKTIKVWAYSNADEVELLLNGRSLGRQKVKPLDHLVWNVVYQPGMLKAKAFSGGEIIKEDSIETTGRPYAVKLFPNKTKLKANARDIAVINFAVVDNKGRIVPDADNEVSFSVSGAGKNIGVGNGDPISLEADHSNKRKAFMGLGQLIIQASDYSGNVLVRATSKGLKPAMTKIPSRK
jgi:beta-galactosidase